MSFIVKSSTMRVNNVKTIVGVPHMRTNKTKHNKNISEIMSEFLFYYWLSLHHTVDEVYQSIMCVEAINVKNSVLFENHSQITIG